MSNSTADITDGQVLSPIRDWSWPSKIAAARACIHNVVMEFGLQISDDESAPLSRALAQAAWRYAVGARLSSHVTAEQYAGAIRGLCADLESAMRHTWAINHMLQPALVLDEGRADFLTRSQNEIADAAGIFLNSPELKAHFPAGLWEGLNAALCASVIAKDRLAEKGWPDTLPTARGPGKLKEQGERRRYGLFLAEIYERITRTEAKANNKGADRPEERRFRLFLREGWKLAGDNHPPGPSGIRTILQSRNSNDRFLK